MTWSDPKPHRTKPRQEKSPTADDRLPTADFFPDRAPLDHVPVYPVPGRSWGEIVLLGSIAVLGIAALAGCWPW